MKVFTNIIASIEMIGGTLGLITTISQYVRIIYQTTQHAPTGYSTSHILLLTLLFILSCCIFLISIWAGYLLFKQAMLGYKLSILIQTLQVPIVLTKFITYDLIVGIQLTIGTLVVNHHPQLTFSSYFGSQFILHFSSPIRFGLYINVVALIFLIILRKTKKRIVNNSAAKDL